jgi:hypothetical protein
MSNQSQETLPTSDESFSPTSFMIFCLDEEGSVAFEASWGDTIDDVKKFAALANSVTNGDFNKMIEEQLKLQSKDEPDGRKKFSAFSKIYSEAKSPSNLVIDPTRVELN